MKARERTCFPTDGFHTNLMMQVTQNRVGGTDYTSWISVGAALGCSAVIAFIIYHGHRGIIRRRAGARGWEILSW